MDLPPDDTNAKEESDEITLNLANEYKNLLNLILHGINNNEDNSVDVSEAAKKIVMSSKEMTTLAEKLKGKNYVDPKDPMLEAENELLKAAQAIELAAQKLAELKPRNEVEGQVVRYYWYLLGFKVTFLQVITDENMTFDDLIIESAKSLANASSALIKAATEAQKELVRQGKIQKTTLKGSTEGQWSEGLVSAAKMVASATQSLCEAANALVLGEGGEENLIAAARQVSTSTNQLFLAFQVRWRKRK